MAKHPKRPRDPAQLAKLIVDLATGEKSDVAPVNDLGENAAKEFARRGGLRGGRARAESLTGEQRTEIAKTAAAARWERKKQRDQ